MKRIQTETDKHVKRLRKDIKDLQDEKETLHLDIDQLYEDFESKLDMISDMDNDLDMLERESRKATIRILGLTQHIDRYSEDAKRTVTEKVLKIACPGEDWSTDDLQRAYRVGEPKGGQPRIMVATFRYSKYTTSTESMVVVISCVKMGFASVTILLDVKERG